MRLCLQQGVHGSTTLVVCCVVEQRPTGQHIGGNCGPSDTLAGGGASWATKAPVRRKYGSSNGGGGSGLAGTSATARGVSGAAVRGGSLVGTGAATAVAAGPAGAAIRTQVVLAIQVRGAAGCHVVRTSTSLSL